MKTVSITVDWTSADSIGLAESAKLKLENKGYKLVNHFGGMFRSVMIYAKIGN